MYSHNHLKQVNISFKVLVSMFWEKMFKVIWNIVSNRSFWSIHRTLTGITIPCQSGSGSNGNERGTLQWQRKKDITLFPKLKSHHHMLFSVELQIISSIISDVLLWTPAYGRAKAGRPTRTYIQQLCEDTGCSPAELPEAMNDREKWRERVRDIRASGTTWWWWWWRWWWLF